MNWRICLSLEARRVSEPIAVTSSSHVAAHLDILPAGCHETMMIEANNAAGQLGSAGGRRTG
jgi:hypothetical protein